MLRRLAAFFVWGALLLGGPAAAAAVSPGSVLDFTAGPAINPAEVALQSASTRAQAAFDFTYSFEPFALTYALAYAVPDTELGAGQLYAQSTRTFSGAQVEQAQSAGYAWGRRFTPRLAAGVQARWEVRQVTVEPALELPQESGLGLDAGVVYDAAPGTWVKAAVIDLFDTKLHSGSGSTTILPAHFNAAVLRQVRPDLRLSASVEDLTGATAGGSVFGLGARLTRGEWTLLGEAGFGSVSSWSIGARLPRGRWIVKAVAEGTGDQAGLNLGVSTLW